MYKKLINIHSLSYKQCRYFANWFQAVNPIYVTQRNFGILEVGVAIMDISQHLFLIDVLHAIYNMHESYRKILSHQPIISVKYWQGYDENTAVH